MIAFTISARNFFGYTQTLYESFSRFHPDSKFYAALCDDDIGFDTEAFPFSVLRLSEIGLPDILGMSERYSITEFNTAIKPYVFQVLFDLHPGETVVYLDPDILVTSRFEELIRLLEDGADCVLTPHVTEPAEHGEFADLQFLRFGVHNLGFCAFRDTPDVRRTIWWWARRLEYQCTIDLEGGLFVDQKWADLLPAYIENTRILRHPGYNVAYWNLAQRRVRHVRGEWLVNGLPLRFFHFSGNKIEDDSVFTRHSVLWRPQNIGPVTELLSEYRQSIAANGHDYFKGIRYAFNWSGQSGDNVHTPESLEAERAAVSSAAPHLPLVRWNNKADYDDWRRLSSSIIEARVADEESDIPYAPSFELSGYCSCCDADSRFYVNSLYSSVRLHDSRMVPNWREQLACERCGFNNRLRAGYSILRQELNPSPESRIYCTQLSTGYSEWLRAIFPATVDSEHMASGDAKGRIVDDAPRDGVEARSFSDESFDYVLSFDILQHVARDESVFRELHRCLKRGGQLLMTVPFAIDSGENVVRATVSESREIEHHAKPEYHGNPVDADREAPRLRHYGWALLDQLKLAGFEQPEVVTYWSRLLRNYGEPQVAIIARK